MRQDRVLGHTFSVKNISTFIKSVKITKVTAESLYQQAIENEEEQIGKEENIVKMWLEFCGRLGKLPKKTTWNLEEILDQNQSGLKRNGLFQ